MDAGRGLPWTTLNPRLSWQGLLRALGAETPRRPPPPDGLQQALVYFDPSDEPPRREWFNAWSGARWPDQLPARPSRAHP